MPGKYRDVHAIVLDFFFLFSAPLDAHYLHTHKEKNIGSTNHLLGTIPSREQKKNHDSKWGS